MELWECEEIIDNYSFLDTQSWEQARSIAYIIAQSNSTKSFKPNDILHFAWDKKEIVHIPTEKEKQQLADMSKKYEKMFAENKI